jgi:hypothetical protein
MAAWSYLPCQTAIRMACCVTPAISVALSTTSFIFRSKDQFHFWSRKGILTTLLVMRVPDCILSLKYTNIKQFLELETLKRSFIFLTFILHTTSVLQIINTPDR